VKEAQIEKTKSSFRSGGAAFGLYVTAAAAAAWCKELARKLF